MKKKPQWVSETFFSRGAARAVTKRAFCDSCRAGVSVNYQYEREPMPGEPAYTACTVIGMKIVCYRNQVAEHNASAMPNAAVRLVKQLSDACTCEHCEDDELRLLEMAIAQG